jgi:hypothetical protein
MAHFAKIDSNNTVIDMTVIDNNELKGLDFPASEPVGQKFIASIGLPGNWLQTSYNGNFRKKYAGLGYTYDKKLDAFIPPKPFNSWILDSACNWQPPVPHPTNLNKLYTWNETSKNWDEAGDFIRPAAPNTQPLPQVGQVAPMTGSGYEVK